MPEYGGGINEREIRSQEKTKAWLDRLEEIEHIRDALGFPIDLTIREAIVGLNISGIPTSASCEGHSDRGRGAPWIKVEAPNRPEERFVGESNIVEMIAAKYHTSVENVRTGRDHEAWKEATHLAADNGETDEYRTWRKENDVLQEKLSTFLEEFYQGRTAVPATHLELTHDAEGTWRVHNGGDDYKRNSRTLDDNERHLLAERLKRYQMEMMAFTEFLKDKYYSSQ